MRLIAVLPVLCCAVGAFAQDPALSATMPKSASSAAYDPIQSATTPAARIAAARAQREAWLIANVPELKGVDPATPEGQAKLQEYQAKRAEEGMARAPQGISDLLSVQRQELKTTLGFTDEEWAAVDPLMVAVMTLRVQRSAIDPNANVLKDMMSMMGGRRGGGRGNAMAAMFSPARLFPDESKHPSIMEIQISSASIKTLLDDPQSKPDELIAAIARLRKGREDFRLAYTKAQDELRTVLTRRQEAQLIEMGLLE